MSQSNKSLDCAHAEEAVAEDARVRAQLEQLLERLDDGPIDRPSGLRASIRLLAHLLVGRMGLKEAQQELRGTMNREALVRTGGSRRAAAHLLRVDRRYVQRLAEEQGDRQSDEPDPVM